MGFCIACIVGEDGVGGRMAAEQAGMQGIQRLAVFLDFFYIPFLRKGKERMRRVAEIVAQSACFVHVVEQALVLAGLRLQ